ncbi:hypothetical protein Tco_1377220 [Tanacetum coccineum]
MLIDHDEDDCKVHWIRAKEATGWIPEFSEDEEDDDHSEQEFISSEQSDLGLHIDGEDNGASEVPETIFENSDGMKERQSEDPFVCASWLNLKITGIVKVLRLIHGSRKFKMSEIPRTGGSILSVMEEIVKVFEEVPLVKCIYLVATNPASSKMSNLDSFSFRNFILGKMLLGNDSNAMRNFVEELRILDELIDKGNGSDEIVNNRLEILGKLQQVNKAQASKVAQKAKIKWYVEGDENTSCETGIPFSTFRTGLIVSGSEAHIDMLFRIHFRLIHAERTLECMVQSKEEVKRGGVGIAEQTNHRVQMDSHLDFTTLLVDY